MTRTVLHAALLSVLMLAPMWFFVCLRWPVSSDMFFYAQSLHLFSGQLWSGDWYPRWLSDANGGTGVPVFVFYSPLSFYLASGLQFLSPLDPHGIGRVILTTQLCQIIAAVSAYLWLGQHFPRKKAQTAALLYAFFPYMVVLFYYAYQFPTLLALACFPLCLFSLDKIVEDKRFCLLFSVSVAWVILSHLLSFLILLPVIILYGAARAKWRWKELLLMFVSGLLGVALATIYWLPALINHPALNQDSFTSGHFDFHNNFSLFFTLILAPVFLFFPLLMAIVDTKKARWGKPVPNVIKFWLIVFVYGYFMATKLSLPIWEAIPLMKDFRFPSRFFIASVPAAVYLCTSLLTDKTLKKMMYLLFSFVLLSATALTSGFYMEQYPDPDVWENHTLISPMSVVGSEYFTSLKPGEFAGGQLAAEISIVSLVIAVLWGLHLFYTHRQGHYDQKLR